MRDEYFGDEKQEVKVDEDIVDSDDVVLSISKSLWYRIRKRMRYWLNEKIEQRADSYASHLIGSAVWWKRWSQRLQFIGLSFRNSFSVLWRR